MRFSHKSCVNLLLLLTTTIFCGFLNKSSLEKFIYCPYKQAPDKNEIMGQNESIYLRCILGYSLYDSSGYRLKNYRSLSKLDDRKDGRAWSICNNSHYVRRWCDHVSFTARTWCACVFNARHCADCARL